MFFYKKNRKWPLDVRNKIILHIENIKVIMSYLKKFKLENRQIKAIIPRILLSNYFQHKDNKTVPSIDPIIQIPVYNIQITREQLIIIIINLIIKVGLLHSYSIKNIKISNCSNSNTFLNHN